MLSKIFHKDLVPFLEEIVSHEKDHCRKFINSMPTRGATPCRAMPLWGIGGWLLGFITAFMGKNTIMICTAAVEKAVHKHMQQQIIYLENKDNEVQKLIIDIQKEELEHLKYAQDNLKNSLLVKPLSSIIAISTEIVIWLSTQGDVSRMKKAISNL